MDIVSRRFDGLGGRLTSMLNAMVLAKTYDLNFQLAWPESDDLISADPREILDVDFIDRYLVNGEALADRRSIVVSPSTFARDLDTFPTGTNSFLEVDWPIGLHPAVEALGPDASSDFASAFCSISLSAALQPVLRHLEVMAGGEWTGVHVRAGDIVTGPWRRTMWHEKYFVSPLLRRAIRTARENHRHVVLVTDNPQYATWLMNTFSGVHASSLMYGSDDDLTDTQRALADLLVLSRCETIVAAARSSFSTLANAIGQSETVGITESVSCDEARIVIAEGIQEQLIDPARQLWSGLTARDLVWSIDVFSDVDDARTLLTQARKATELDSEFTSAWARRARLAARCGRFREAWMAVDSACTTARDDRRQEDSTVDAELALIAVGIVELIWRGWMLSNEVRSAKLDRVVQSAEKCEGLRPHHWQQPALDVVAQIFEHLRHSATQSRWKQVTRSLRDRHFIRQPWEVVDGQRPFDDMTQGNLDALALDVTGILRALHRDESPSTGGR